MHFMFKGEGSSWLDDNSPFSHYSASITIKSCAVAILFLLKEYLQQISLICQKLYCCQSRSFCDWEVFRWSFRTFFLLTFVILGPKRLTNPFSHLFIVASCTRSISFLTPECVFSLLLMATVRRNLFVDAGATSSFQSGRQQWSSGGLFSKSAAILIYIFSLSRIIFHFLK